MLIILFVALSLMTIQDVFADPCGMVPPIAISDMNRNDAISRVGIQRTYVMYKEGIETMVLHPQFKGEIDDFGMLIPFPSPPEIRKVDDNIFAQLESAIAPPEIHIFHYDDMSQFGFGLGGTGLGGGGLGGRGMIASLGTSQIIVREEALGMYQVAVIEAGSAQALKKWMLENQYRFPNGMEEVAQEYIDESWAFVAIKTQIGQKPNIEAKAGMRDIRTTLEHGSSFDGYVQSMGFRFQTSEPVIPMRLSIFNGVDPQNIIYFLSEDPMKIRSLDESYIDTFIKGTELYQNLISPLSVVYKSGEEAILSEKQRQQIKKKTDASNYLKQAKTLLSADLMAIRKNRLSLNIEKKEKELLNMSEAFGLRGPAINMLHTNSIAEEMDRSTNKALKDLEHMTMTIFSGVLPNEFIKSQNLYFTKIPYTEKESTRINLLVPKPIIATAYGTQDFTFTGEPITKPLLTFTRDPTSAKVTLLPDLKVTGDLDSRQVNRSLKRRMNTFRFCYQRELSQNPNIRGTINIEFIINTEGKIYSERIIKSTLLIPIIEQCLLDRVKRIRFISPKKGESTIQFTLKFDP
jgi:hypothetical protein